MLMLAFPFLPLSQAATAAVGDRQDVDEHCSSLSAGPRGLCRGHKAEQPCHHAGRQQRQPGLQVWKLHVTEIMIMS